MKRRLLIIGTGSIGERHLRCFLATGRVTPMICETNDELAAAVAERFGVQEVFDRWENAIDSAPDAAVVCTPAHLHVDMATALLERDIGVLVEKPLSTNWTGVDYLVELAERDSTRAAVAYVMRLQPALASMRAEIRSGRFGRPLQVIASGGQHFPTYRPAYRDTYYRDRARGGGAIQDALTHIVNAVEWIVGPALRVAAQAAHKRLDNVEVEDTVHAIVDHGDVMASYALNQHQAPNELTITVVCEHGTCRYEAHRQRWRWMADPDSLWTLGLEGAWERDDFFVLQAKAFLDYLDGNGEPPCTVREAAQTLRVNMALLDAADEGDAFRGV